jgi:hypothetical protein
MGRASPQDEKLKWSERPTRSLVVAAEKMASGLFVHAGR